ncbi:MAG: PEP-CTERM sorting domain-containing protein [Akkermansiaceae bacterium]
MKLKLSTILAITSLGVGATQAASVAWDNTSTDGKWLTPANWDADTLPASSDDVTISNGDTVDYVAGADLSVTGGGSITVTGGSALKTDQGNWSQFNNGSVTLDNGTFTRTAGGNLVLGFDSSNTIAVGMSNSSNLTVGGELWFGRNVANTGVTASLTISDSTVAANGGVGIWFWNSDNNNYNLNVVGIGSSIQGRLGYEATNGGGANNSATWESLWTLGILQHNGSSAGAFADHFETTGTAGNTNYTLTAIPEPSSTALLGLGGLALVLRRRK